MPFVPRFLSCLAALAFLAAPLQAQPAGPMPAGGPGAPRPDMPLDASQRAKILRTLADKLTANYVFPDVAAKMVAALQANDKRGAYNGDATANALAAHLRADLQDISHDVHIQLRYHTELLPEDIPQAQKAAIKPSADERARALADDKLRNFGIEKFERLPGNIAYLELTGFLNPETSGEAIAAAMTLVADAEALIVDLRRNGGGDPATVALMTSYLFDGDPVHLNDLQYRWETQPHQYWTHHWVPGKRFGPTKPVYVLTSGRTFSAAEEFSNNLKVLKRATLVGATTGGGANPGDVFKLADHVSIFIPTGRAINPVTQTNWEGVGVVPDVAVPQEQALLTAQIMAMKPLVAKITEPFRREGANRQLAELQARLDAMKASALK